MKRIGIILLLAAAFFGFLSSCSNSTDDTFSGSVVLKDFVYDGSHTLHLAVFDRGGSDTFLSIEDSSTSLHTYTTTYTGTGPEDVVVADIYIEEPDFDVAAGLDLFLMIASDEDDSGDLTSGDLVLPFFSLLLRNGETLELEGLEFHTSYADVGSYSADPATQHVWLSINDLLPYTVDTENVVKLLIHEASIDFSATSYYKEIVIKDRRLLGDMMLYSFDSNTYYFLLHYDTNGDGSISSGDHVSYSDYTAVSSEFSRDLTSSSGELTLGLNSYTVVP